MSGINGIRTWGDGGINPELPEDAPLLDATGSSASALSASPTPTPTAPPSRNSVMVNLTSAPGAIPPGDDGSRRAGTNIVIGNPLTDAVAHSSQ